VVAAAELDAVVGELAARMAAGPTAAYAAIKKAVDFGMSHSLEETLEVEAELQDACAGAEDHRNAVRAFLAKEKPVFTGR
jgi:2-(1,2-epoxy-1,2-dihydrophenyl)acetyl-CoA isomerase